MQKRKNQIKNDLNAQNLNIQSSIDSNQTPIINIANTYNNDYLRTISDLNSYKNLCEEYIKYYFPTESFPLTPQSLYIKKSKNNMDTNNPLLIQLEENNRQLVAFQNEKKELVSIINSQNVENDKQRNYIKLLKQTLESSLVKNGLSSIIKLKNSNLSQSSMNISSLNELVDTSKLYQDAENAKKELDKSYLKISEMNNELLNYKKTNSYLENEINILKEKLSQYNINEDNLNKEIKLKNENELNKEMTIKELKEENDKLKSNLTEHKSLINQYENQIKQNERTINELNNDLTKFNDIENKYNNNTIHCDQLEYNYKELNKEKNDLELKIIKLNESITHSKNEYSDLMKSLNEQNIQNETEKKKLIENNNSLQRTINKLANQINEFVNDINGKKKEIQKLKQNEIDNENLNMGLKKDKDNVIKEFNDYKNDNEIKMEILNKNIIELNQKLNKYQLLYNDIQNSNKNLNQSNIELNKDKDLLSRSIDEYEKKYNEINDNYNQMKQLYENKCNEYQNLYSNFVKIDNDFTHVNKEIPLLKNNYDVNLNEKNNKIINLNKEIYTLSNEINNLYGKINNLNSDKLTLDNKNKELLNSNTEINSILVNLKNNIVLLNNDIMNKDNQINDLTKKNNDLVNKNKTFVKQINKLKSDLNNSTIQNNQFNLMINSQESNINKLQSNNESMNHHLDKLNIDINNIISIILDCITLINEYKNSLNINHYSEEYINYLKSLDFEDLEIIDKINILKTFMIQLMNESTSQIESCQNKLSLLTDHNNNLINKIKELEEEIENKKNELLNLEEFNNRYQYENDNKDTIISKSNFQLEALEERIVILNKEKKLYENICNQLCLKRPFKSLSSSIYQLLNIIDQIAINQRNQIKPFNDRCTLNFNEKNEQLNKQYSQVFEEFVEKLNNIDRKFNVDKVGFGHLYGDDISDTNKFSNTVNTTNYSLNYGFNSNNDDGLNKTYSNPNSNDVHFMKIKNYKSGCSDKVIGNSVINKKLISSKK